jgi:hypothetical protein
MDIQQSELFEFALSLPQPARADLAFQLLQTLEPPSEEVTSSEFGRQLQERIDSHARGELSSVSVDEAREIVQARLSQERSA